jgi:deoxyadenosine/deoxycytidine kinase
MRIEIAGALGVGKSTLSDALEARGCHVVREDVTGNPYLELQTSDPKRYAFLAQQRFIEDKISGIDAAVASGHRVIVSDFSKIVELAYAEFYDAIDDDQRAELGDMVDEWYASSPPDIIAYLQCDPVVHLDRIQRRGRDFEKSCDIAFIQRITEAMERRIASAHAKGFRVIRVDTTDLSPHGPLPEIVAALI